MRGSTTPALKENPMSQHRITWMMAAGAASLIGFGGTVAVPVAGASPVTKAITVNAKCSGTSVANLQIQREDTGKLSVDVGVDMARHTSGVRWRVGASDNGTVFILQTASTISDGSFSITRFISPKPGTNTIVATAVNLTTHEHCSVRGSL
jgi:hypothetical protein